MVSCSSVLHSRSLLNISSAALFALTMPLEEEDEQVLLSTPMRERWPRQ